MAYAQEAMADASGQVKVQKWVSEVWLSQRFGQPFQRGQALLSTGGKHSFAAVSSDGKSVASIHSSGAATASGKLAVGKLTKVRADMLFLLMATAPNKYAIFVDRGMFELVLQEKQKGRVPQEIQCLWVEDLPAELKETLAAAQQEASAEMLP